MPWNVLLFRVVSSDPSRQPGDFHESSTTLVIWALAILSLGISAPAGTGPVAAVVGPPPMAFTAVDPDSDIPMKEYGLPDREDEQDGEEEDQSDSELLGADLNHPPVVRPISPRAGYSIANRWVLGLGPIARMPFMRC